MVGADLSAQCPQGHKSIRTYLRKAKDLRRKAKDESRLLITFSPLAFSPFPFLRRPQISGA